MMLRTILSIAVLVGVAGGLLLSHLPVYAHADYDHSEPGRDEVLPAPPEQVDVWFTQDVRKREGFYFVRVFDEAGAQVSDGDGAVDDDDRAHIAAALTADLQPGRYIVEWMTTSDIDGDDDEGAFCFYVGVDPTEEQEAECAEFGEDEPTVTPAQPAEPTADPTPTVIAPSDVGGDADDGGVSGGVLIGIITGVVVVAVVVGGAVVWLRRS